MVAPEKVTCASTGEDFAKLLHTCVGKETLLQGSLIAPQVTFKRDTALLQGSWKVIGACSLWLLRKEQTSVRQLWSHGTDLGSKQKQVFNKVTAEQKWRSHTRPLKAAWSALPADLRVFSCLIFKTVKLFITILKTAVPQFAHAESRLIGCFCL